jgi:tetratricopeptide (TPR) repeat protein
MRRFGPLLISLMLLTFGVLSAQEPSEPGSALPPRVAPPPENATAKELEHQGDALRSEKAYLDSVDYYRAAGKKADTAVLHNKIGISLFQLHRDSEAKKEYERAIKLDSAYPEVHNNLGALLYNARRYGPAVKEYRKAIRISEENATFHVNLGTAYFSEKDFDGAIREYRRARELDPSVFDRQPSGGVSIKLISSSDLGHFHYMMAQVSAGQGDLERCRIYLSKANEEGYNARDALRDGQFAGLRKDPQFVSFLRSLKPPSVNE